VLAIDLRYFPARLPKLDIVAIHQLLGVFLGSLIVSATELD